jgi:DNA-directed RNA polymerase subunit L
MALVGLQIRYLGRERKSAEITFQGQAYVHLLEQHIRQILETQPDPFFCGHTIDTGTDNNSDQVRLSLQVPQDYSIVDVLTNALNQMKSDFDAMKSAYVQCIQEQIQVRQSETAPIESHNSNNSNSNSNAMSSS